MSIEFDLSGKSGMNPEELEAQEVLEVQLRHTVYMINALDAHPHYTDDCGEYLRSTLELSARLMSAREDGIEGLILEFKELAKTPEGGDEDLDTELSMSYAEYTPAVEKLVNKYKEEVKDDDEDRS